MKTATIPETTDSFKRRQAAILDLERIEVGDTVVIEQRYRNQEQPERTIHVVTKVTKKQIVIDGGGQRFNRETGERIGGHRSTSTSIRLPREGEIDEIEEDITAKQQALRAERQETAARRAGRFEGQLFKAARMIQKTAGEDDGLQHVSFQLDSLGRDIESAQGRVVQIAEWMRDDLERLTRDLEAGRWCTQTDRGADLAKAIAELQAAIEHGKTTLYMVSKLTGIERDAFKVASPDELLRPEDRTHDDVVDEETAGAKVAS